MSKIIRILGSLSLDGWTFLLCGIAAVILVVLDFIEIVHFTNEEALRIIIVAIGLILGAIATQSARRTAELKELREALGATTIERIESDAHVQQSIIHAKKFILDTTLHLPRAKIVHPADDPTNYHYTIFERVKRKEVTYRKVESIPNKERLEYVLSRLIIFDGMDYLVRYYDSSSKPIPVLNIMSIDNESFYLGSFYNSDAPTETSSDVFIKSQTMGRLFESYWNNLWNSAKPLNEARRIDWDELKVIANKVAMSDKEFNSIVNRWKAEVQRRKRRTR